MKMAQILKAGSRFQIVERELPKPRQRDTSRFRPVVFATARCLRKKARRREFSIPAFQDMR
jgi:hypothetical protein